MPESSAPRTALPAPVRPGLAAVSGACRSLTGLLARWLPYQRWYADKGRPLSGLAVVSVTELLPCVSSGTAPGLLHLLVRTVPRGQPQQSGSCYQLLLGVTTVLPPQLAPALLGRPTDGPLRGRAIYDALPDPRLTGVLLERLRVPGRLGQLTFEQAPEAVIPPGLPARALTGDQTNSSVVYGETHILKLFRRVSPGINPDLELPRALAGAGCDRVPPPAAWFSGVWPDSAAGSLPAPADGAAADGYARVNPGVPAPSPESDPRAGEPGPPSQGSDPPAVEPGPLTLGVLQPYLAGSIDGWQLALKSLAARADFQDAAHALGQTTAEVHRTLHNTLPTTTLGGAQLLATAHAMQDRLSAAAAAVPALRPYQTGLGRAFTALADYAARGGRCAAQRLHGDLHLGQALYRGGGWSLIDFEGEPARPLCERRRPHPPVRDVAGMLRSFDYAAGQQRQPGSWVAEWAAANRAAYCRGYCEVAGEGPLSQPELLRAFETDKAVYEVLYEARHRPSWLHIPMTAVRRLAGQDP